MAIVLDSPDFFGHTVFCDDIRMEVDGKITFVGAYRGRMYVHTPFPLTLPKLGVAISFTQKKDLFVPNVGIRIFLPTDSDDNASIQGDLTEVSEGAVVQEIESQPKVPESRYITLRANLVMSPFVVEKAGSIKVRILRNDELHRVGRLQILRGQTDPTPATAP